MIRMTPKESLCVKRIETERLTIVDENQKPCLQLGVNPDGGGTLELLDKDEKVRLRLCMTTDGCGIALSDKDEKIRAGLIVSPDGNVVLEFADQDGKQRATLGVGSDGNGGLNLRDKDSKVIWSAP